MNITIDDFIYQLSSKSPVPGGGGASALLGAIGVSLCSMVANLTSGNVKYAEFQAEIDDILVRTDCSIKHLLELIQKDADVFEPLSKAYRLPDGFLNREEILEEALQAACSVPMEIMLEIVAIIDIIEQLVVKGTTLAVSDVGVAATACRSALEGAAMNVYINTKLMKNKEYALKRNNEVIHFLQSGVERCNRVYEQISEELSK